MNIEVAVENLRGIEEVFDKNGISYWLDSGTLLGAVRDGKIIEWDDDVDLGTWYDNAKQIIGAFLEFQKKGFKLVLHMYPAAISIHRFGCKISIKLYHKGDYYAYVIWVVEKKKIEQLLNWFKGALTQRTYMKQKGTFMRKREFFSFLIPQKLKQFLADAIWSVLGRLGCLVPVVIPKRYFEKLSTIRFYGIRFNIPSDIEEYLEYRYGGNWKIPTKNWIHYKDDGAIHPDWKTPVKTA